MKILLTTVIFLCGCTTVTFVRKETSPTKQAVLRYQPPSSEKKEQKYKDEVEKEATKFCAGNYKITREYQARDNTGTSTGVGTGFGVGFGGVLLGTSTANTAMYNFVEFQCL